MEKKVALKRKSDGKFFTIIGGYILPKEKVTKDVDGSFVTLQSVEDPQHTVLYIWPYWAEPEYEILTNSEEIQ